MPSIKRGNGKKGKRKKNGKLRKIKIFFQNRLKTFLMTKNE